MVKLILTDLDHTLLREDGSVSDETLRVLDECRNKGIAVANAVPEALAAADELTGSNNEDGVACWLKENCIGGLKENI